MATGQQKPDRYEPLIALLVVGSHGHHSSHDLAGLHLGSVAGFCVHHAPCPVLVYRDHGQHDEHGPPGAYEP